LGVLLSNAINLIFNLLTNFLLPKYLSVGSYAAIKTFQLYTTYVGIFALGYADGMYLRYGGKQFEKINHEELKSCLKSFRLMMLAESIIIIPLTLLYQDKVIIGFALTIFTMNMTSFYKNLYQAVGEFKKYGRILNWTTIATFAVNMSLLFIIKTDNYFIYLIFYALVDAIIWFWLEINFYHFIKSNTPSSFSLRLIVEDIKNGFLLMIGNFSNILLSSMDRWFVKVMMTSAQFAYYSFAVSMEGFLNVAITPITTTLYNYFCNNTEESSVIKIRRYVMIFGTLIAAAAFPAKFIIEVYLTNYNGSSNVLFILFGTQMIYVIIKGIYVNLYKATKQQNKYFIRLVLILAIGALLNYIFVKIYPYKEAFAFGTLVSAFIWLLFCIMDFKRYNFSFREWLYLCSELIGFILLGITVNSIIGFIAYMCLTVILLVLLMRKETKMAFKIFCGYINKIKRRRVSK
jgi:O-antigen/teichoic acid export membrane protein